MSEMISSMSLIEADLVFIGEMAVELKLIHDVNNVNVIRPRRINNEKPSDWVLAIGETSACWNSPTLAGVLKLAKDSLEEKIKLKRKRKTPKGTYKEGRWELIRNIDEFKDYHLDILEFPDGEIPVGLAYPSFPFMAFGYFYEGSVSGQTDSIYLGVEEAKRLLDFVK